MKRHFKFITILTVILATRAFDAYSTYLFTPDLSKEENPLASLLGNSWTPLLLVLGLLLLYVVYTLYLNIYKPVNIIPDQKGLTFGEFVRQTYFGRPETWFAMLYKMPNDLKRLNYIMGYILSRSLIWAGIITTIMWLLINHTETYYNKYHSYKLTIIILLLGAFFISFYYFRQLYKIYQNKNYSPAANRVDGLTAGKR